MNSFFRLSTGSGFDLIGPSFQLFKHVSVSLDCVLLCKCFFNYTYFTLPVAGLARWDWPFTWWTDQLLSFSALSALLGGSSDLTDMTYTVFGGTLNPTLLLLPLYNTVTL